MLFSYFGPETSLPIASSIAALVGTLLIGWRFVQERVNRWARAVRGR